jgi:hypothetical protein
MLLMLAYNVILTFGLMGVDWSVGAPITMVEITWFTVLMLAGTFLFALVIANMTSAILTAEVIDLAPPPQEEIDGRDGYSRS